MTADVRRRIGRPGAAHPNYKGGWRDEFGYIHIGKKLRSHIVWNAAHPDDPILPGQVIHHRNEIKDDDRPENLEKLPSQSVHAAMHFAQPRPHLRKTQAKPCEHCGGTLTLRQQYERRRFCSYPCSVAFRTGRPRAGY